MARAEARQILGEHLSRYRVRSYSELATWVRDRRVDACTAKDSSGREVHLEVSFFWDDRPDGNIRVTGSVCDGGWRCLFPRIHGFIRSPDGGFVGE